MKWLDRRLCWLLGDYGDDENDKILCGDAIAAIVYRHQQDAIVKRLVLTEFPEQARGPVRCLFLASTSDTSHLQDNIKQYYCDLQVLRSVPPTRIFFDVHVDAKHFYWDWNRSSNALLQDVEGSGVGLGQRRIADYDCVYIDADYGNADCMCSEGDSLLSSMTSSQTFVTSGLLRYLKARRGYLGYMKEMFWSLGGYGGHRLFNTAANWRIRCNYRRNDCVINFEEVVRWA
ncbi:unnamed protein product, partial [Taenia asiatica]